MPCAQTKCFGEKTCKSLFTKADTIDQGVTKRCRLSLLTNSALVIRVQLRGKGGGSCGVSRDMEPK